VIIGIGARHFGLDRTSELKTVQLAFGASSGSLIATLPAAMRLKPAAVAA
jgi:hypothetical protein